MTEKQKSYVEDIIFRRSWDETLKKVYIKCYDKGLITKEIVDDIIGVLAPCLHGTGKMSGSEAQRRMTRKLIAIYKAS